MIRAWVAMAMLTVVGFGGADNVLAQAFPARSSVSATSQSTTEPSLYLKQVAVLEATSNAVAFSPDGKLLAVVEGQSTSVSSRGSLAVYGLQEKRVLQKANGRNAYSQVAFTPDGAKIVAASLYQVDVWDVRAWKRLATHAFDVEQMAVSPDGKMLAVSGRLRTLRNPPGVTVFDLSTGKEIRSFRGHFTNAVAFSPDSGRLAACSDTEITFWDTKSWESSGKTAPSGTAPQAACPIVIRGISFPQGDLCLLNMFQEMNLWDPKPATARWSVPVVTAAVSSDSQWLATVESVAPSRSCNLVIRNMPNEKPLFTWDLGDRHPYGLTLSRDGTLVAWSEINERDRSKDKLIVWRIQR